MPDTPRLVMRREFPVKKRHLSQRFAFPWKIFIITSAATWAWGRHERGEAICHGPQHLRPFFVGMSKTQGPRHSSPRPFLRVVFAAGNLEGWGNLSPWPENRLASAYFREAPQAQRSSPVMRVQAPTMDSASPLGLGGTGAGTHISLALGLLLLPEEQRTLSLILQPCLARIHETVAG